MVRRLVIWTVALGIVGGAVFFWLTQPSRIEAAALPNHQPDVANGEVMFHAGGCASCHATPQGLARDGRKACDNPKYEDARKLGGGRCLKTPFGTFFVPNISPDRENGIGRWSMADFVTAMKKGVSPDGRHYYPAFPYTSYQRMRTEDIMDLKAFIDTLPAVKTRAPDHDLPLIFSFRRGLGLWKLLFLDGRTFTPDPKASPAINRGAYLVQGPGHCGECHTPRNIFGAMDETRALSGAPDPEGKGFVPNITPHKTGIGAWSAKDIAYALKTGFTPEFDSFGGSMVKVQENMAKLSEADRQAIAAYLKSLPPRPSSARAKSGKTPE